MGATAYNFIDKKENEFLDGEYICPNYPSKEEDTNYPTSPPKGNQILANQKLLFKSFDSMIRGRKEGFKVIQKWEGIVEGIYEKFISVKLVDLTNGGSDEEAEIEYIDIQEDDRELLEIGAMFYWSIGYEKDQNGTIRRSSLIKFKRLPRIESSEFDDIYDRAKEINRTIKWD